MKLDYTDAAPEELLLAKAIPPGWVQLDRLTITWEFEPRPGYPGRIYSFGIQIGRNVGTRDRPIVGGFVKEPVGRRIEVRVSAPTIDALCQAISHVASLDWMLDLPVDSETKVETVEVW